MCNFNSTFWNESECLNLILVVADLSFELKPNEDNVKGRGGGGHSECVCVCVYIHLTAFSAFWL